MLFLLAPLPASIFTCVYFHLPLTLPLPASTSAPLVVQLYVTNFYLLSTSSTLFCPHLTPIDLTSTALCPPCHLALQTPTPLLTTLSLLLIIFISLTARS